MAMVTMMMMQTAAKLWSGPLPTLPRPTADCFGANLDSSIYIYNSRGGPEEFGQSRMTPPFAINAGANIYARCLLLYLNDVGILKAQYDGGCSEKLARPYTDVLHLRWVLYPRSRKCFLAHWQMHSNVPHRLSAEC